MFALHFSSMPITIKPCLPLIIGFFIIQYLPAQEPAELIRLREQFVGAANRAVDPTAKKYVQQLELLKANYHKQGKNQERDHVESEIVKINQATEAGLVKVPVGDLVNKAGSVAGGMGKDLSDLQGLWVRPKQSGGSSEAYEFKQRKMVRIFEYATQDGGFSEQRTNFVVKQTGEKIIITIDGRESSEYRQWYEINLPFSIDKLEMVNFSERPDGSSKNILYLNRKSLAPPKKMAQVE
jgi:hypothetical protein